MAAKSSNLALRFKAREEFNNHRCIQLINLPPSTEGELQEFLGNFRAKKIKINDSLDSALVVLENGNQIDEAVEKLNNKEFKDNTVTVKYGFSNQLICIAHIPLSYTESQFKDMCEKYGTVEYSYIMRTEDTGDGKGYGFVEFAVDIEQAKLIKSEFDWKNVDGQILHADFVEEHGQSWERLQSRCLLINNMPENFVDVSKLREMFGVITSPVYCQIIAKGDRSLGYGIVEFRTAEDAEKTWFKLKDEKIQGKDLILTFCIPGKSAVVINNRIMWKFGDKLTKSTSLLPDPVSAKPVIAGNPIVISLSKFNPSLMDEFAKVLNELQQAYVSQMMSPVNKPGLLGPAPSLPLSPMMNPNMQLGLLVMLAIHIQAAKKEQFIGVLAKQLNTLSELDVISDFKGPKPSILGDPLTGQANVILTSLKQQLNQVPLTEDGKELKEPDALYDKINYIVKKFIANGRYLNLSLLNNLGQLLVTMKQVDIGGRTATGMKGQSLLGPVPGILPQPLLGSNKSTSLLGDPPSIGPLSNLGSANVNTSIMQAIGLNVGSSNTVGNVGQSLLSQISQGLVHQIEQNLLYQMSVGQTNQNNSSQNTSGRGLLGDIPSNVPKNKNVSTSKSSLLGEPPAHLKAVHSSMPPTSQLDQNAWKGMGNKKNVETNFDMMNNSDRWGTGAYESGYNNKVRPNQGYNYSYNDTYTDVTSGYGGYNETGSDFYNYQSYCYNAQQVEQFYQTDGSCNSQFGSSNYGSGGGSSGLSGPGNGYGSGQNSNQASGVNFQDGQTFVKGGISGLGQDNTKCIGDNYNMGMGNYGYGNRDELGNGFDSYGSVMGSYSTSTDNVVGATGTGNIGGTGLLNSSGGSQGILGSGPVSSGGGNNLLGTGRGDGLYGTVGASSGLLGSGAGYYGTGTFMGSGSGVGMSSNLSDSMSTYNAGLGMNAAGKNNFGMGLLGSGSNVSSGNMTNRMSGISNRDSANSSTYYTGTSSTLSSGLLPSPSKHATPVGQKRSHTQLLPKPEQSPDGSDYIGQHSQGLGGHYLDSFKKSRLF